MYGNEIKIICSGCWCLMVFAHMSLFCPCVMVCWCVMMLLVCHSVCQCVAVTWFTITWNILKRKDSRAWQSLGWECLPTHHISTHARLRYELALTVHRAEGVGSQVGVLQWQGTRWWTWRVPALEANTDICEHMTNYTYMPGSVCPASSSHL